jgi:hypothetical protein
MAPSILNFNKHVYIEDKSDDSEMPEGDSGSDSEAGARKEDVSSSSSLYYRPSQGEDLYGRVTAPVGSSGKYVPPALRNKLQDVVDEVMTFID